jgi:hypothetical protein
MGHPLKPFVVEHRQPNRRHKQSPRVSDVFGPSTSPARTSQVNDSNEAVMRAADAVFGKAPPAVAAVPDAAESALEANPAKPGDKAQTGRILPALDEANTLYDPLALRLAEAEKTGSRRGRKPGSKNKPKISTVVPVQPMVPVAPIVTEPEVSFLSVSSAPRFRQPFAWIKKEIALGEHWKRRLPKICW